jgi:hypothetical protein
MSDEYDCSRFTHKYHKYEEGQQNFIVKGRFKCHIDFWKKIGCFDFIYNIIDDGYKIPLYSQSVNVICKNHESTSFEQDFVSQAINDLLDRHLIKKMFENSSCS